ncbi:hypothetical protein EGW08_016444, partial [Elysia chlorotica]
MTSRIGAIISPFVINLDHMPLFTFILMTSMTLASMVITCFIPETRNKVMAETVHEQTVGASGSEQGACAVDIDNKDHGGTLNENGKDSKKDRLELGSRKLPSVVEESLTDCTPLSSSDSKHRAQNRVFNYGYTETQDSRR